MSDFREGKMSLSPEERVNILGVGVSAVSLEDTLNRIRAAVEADERGYICVTPVHSIMDCQDDPELVKTFNQSYLTVPDGMPLVWILKTMGHSGTERVYGAELMIEAIQQFSVLGYRHYLYGAAPEIAEKVARRFQDDDPGINFAGTFSPPFRELSDTELQAIVDEINESDPQIIWVALGAPKQERWMAAHRNKLNAPVMLGVGVAFDYLAGTKRQAPRWMRNSGLEWFFRLLTEPRRVWSRYIRYPYFIVLLLAQWTGLIEYPEDKQCGLQS